MENLKFALTAAWQVLLAALILGAGLPSLFAVGIRALAYGAGGDAEVSHEKGNPAGTVIAWVCFGIVLLGIALGITFIVASGFGKQLSFEHVYPMIVDKKK